MILEAFARRAGFDTLDKTEYRLNLIKLTITIYIGAFYSVTLRVLFSDDQPSSFSPRRKVLITNS